MTYVAVGPLSLRIVLAGLIPCLALAALPTSEKVDLLAGELPTLQSSTMTDLGGATIDSQNWLGRITILNMWATWCAPCREELPDLIELQRRYPESLVVIAISVDTGPTESVRDFVTRHNITFPVIMQDNARGLGLPAIDAVPTTFVADDTGRMVRRFRGRVSLKTLDQDIRALITLGAQRLDNAAAIK